MKNSKAVTSNQICRSLLQKAVRRGAVSVAEKATIYLIQEGESTWLRNRLGVITFEEIWARTGDLQFTTDENCLIAQYKNLARSSKNKDAAGLGSLAYELSKGSFGVLTKNAQENRHIKIVAEAIKRPEDFWTWAKKNTSNLDFLHKAEIGYKYAGWPWDKAFALASAYLSICGEVPPTTEHDLVSIALPFWVAIDKHTPTGKLALAKCAEKININKNTLGWIQFYLESSKCENLQTSPWWEREKAWRLQNEGLRDGKEKAIWQNISAYLHELLEPQALKLENDLNHSFALYQSTLKNQENLI